MKKLIRRGLKFLRLPPESFRANKGAAMAKPDGPFGQWLRQWRKDNRWTISGFAGLIGMSKSYVWELEHGVTFNPSLETLMAISKHTGTAFTKVALLAATQKLQEKRP
jgi:transcriptional regulator with XRE-family HTH domain